MFLAEGKDEAFSELGRAPLVGEGSELIGEGVLDGFGEVGGLSDEGFLCFVGASWVSGDSSEGEARFLDDVAVVDEKARSEGDGGDVHLASLGDFGKSAHSGEIAGDVDGDEEFVFLEDGGAVAGEEFVEGDGSLFLWALQSDGGVEGEEDRRGVADGGGGDEVAAEGGAVPDLAGGEEAQHFAEGGVFGGDGFEFGEGQAAPMCQWVSLSLSSNSSVTCSREMRVSGRR